MVDSTVVIYGQTLAYTIYCIVLILLMAWFAYKVTRGGNGTFVKPAIFYTFVGFLTVLGVSLHLDCQSERQGFIWCKIKRSYLRFWVIPERQFDDVPDAGCPWSPEWYPLAFYETWSLHHSIYRVLWSQRSIYDWKGCCGGCWPSRNHQIIN